MNSIFSRAGIISLSGTIAAALAMSAIAVAGEQGLDLDQETAPTPPPSHASKRGDGVKLMGRVDLTYEVSPFQGFSTWTKNDTLTNYHFFVFLKAQPSAQVEFMGEVLQKSFYEIRYTPSELVTLKFGKIMVPFGDTSRFHHFYGGVPFLGGAGIMFKTIWAEQGADAEWRLPGVTLDTYVVNGVAGSASANPDFKSSDTKTQAVGLRATTEALPKVKLIGSLYYDRWRESENLYLVGGDVITSYKLIDAPVVRNLRLAAGVANGWVRGGIGGDFRKYGDYLELATNVVSFLEPRVRYGTYIDNSAARSSKDLQALDLSANIPINALNLLVEYTFNWEAYNEVNNNVLRAMLSLDF